MKIFISLIAFAFIPLNMVSQGILDSLTSSNIIDTVAENNAVHDNVSPVQSYPYSSYLRDSLKVSNLHDSIASQWTLYDSLPEKKQKVVLYNTWYNKELVKNNPRPLVFTILFFVILIGFVIKATFFGRKIIFEYQAGLRALVYDEWFEGQLTIINVYNVFSKLLSVFLHALIISYLLFKLNWDPLNMFSFTVPFILLGLIAIVILKYFLGWFFGIIFQNASLVKHHFTVNQLNDNLLFLPLLICFILSYFLYGIQNFTWLLVVGAGLIAINRLISLTLFGVISLLNRDNKKFYVFFYLCALEIIPVLLLAKFMAVSYL